RRECALAGFGVTVSRGVGIEIEGDPAAVGAFPDLLRRKAPPLSRIEGIEVADLEIRGEEVFRVVASDSQLQTRVRVPVDTATCSACLTELFDPLNRRY